MASLVVMYMYGRYVCTRSVERMHTCWLCIFGSIISIKFSLKFMFNFVYVKLRLFVDLRPVPVIILSQDAWEWSG